MGADIEHAHLLMRTGLVPISKVMQRLLTGHAVYFNRRNRQSGHVFQNRYKSILCQEDSYLLELVRYIHLNPLRAKIVANYGELAKYGFCGHSVILGYYSKDWQDIDYVLKLFGEKLSSARRGYRDFVRKGIGQGKRDDLVGGGLLRSQGGWSAVKTLRRIGAYQKGDERILGDSDFVQEVLSHTQEQYERKYRLIAEGFELENLIDRVAELMEMGKEEVVDSGKHRKKVEARSLLCYWATNDLGVSQIRLAQMLNLTQPAISMAVDRGRKLASSKQYSIS